jgi:hypothetical protein
MSKMGVPASECLQRNNPAPSNVLVKEFARWYCKSRHGRLARQPNIKSVQNILKKFFAGFQRVTETKINDELRNDVYFVSIAQRRYTLGEEERTRSRRRSHQTYE